jgi:annexin A7/11
MFLSQNDLQILNKFLTTPKPEKDLMNSFINLITTSSKAHLEELHSMYDKAYTPDLLTSLKKTLSGNILNASISLLTSSIEYDCLQLRNAMEGIGTDEDILIEIIGTRTNDILKDIIQQYPKVNKGRDLIKDIKNETSGSFRQLLLLLLDGNKSYNCNINEEECCNCAKKLFEAYDKMWGSDDCVFNKIFAFKSPVELAFICREYHKLSNYTLMKTIDTEFSGNNKKLLNTIINVLISPSEFFAKKINKALNGVGKNEKLLIRILVTRRDIDLNQIKQYYKQLFRKNMIDDIKESFTGIFGKLIIGIAKG